MPTLIYNAALAGFNIVHSDITALLSSGPFISAIARLFGA